MSKKVSIDLTAFATSKDGLAFYPKHGVMCYRKQGWRSDPIWFIVPTPGKGPKPMLIRVALLLTLLPLAVTAAFAIIIQEPRTCAATLGVPACFSHDRRINWTINPGIGNTSSHQLSGIVSGLPDITSIMSAPGVGFYARVILRGGNGYGKTPRYRKVLNGRNRSRRVGNPMAPRGKAFNSTGSNE